MCPGTSPSEADSDDSLEWASETERTMAEDALAEGTVGLDFYGAAVSVATEFVSSYKPVQMGLSLATILPVASLQRAARAARRAGTKNIEKAAGDSSSSTINTINSVLSYLGFHLISDEDADYEPSDSEGSEDELEYNSDASDISEGEPEEETSERRRFKMS